MSKDAIYEGIVNRINTGIAVINSHNEIIFINKEGEKIAGSGKNREKLFSEFVIRAKTDKKIERTEIVLGKKVIGATFTPEGIGEDSFCTVVFQDITQIKIKEQEEKNREKLIHLGEFATYIAHEVRNPLNLIKGFSELMLESSDMDFIKNNLKIVISESDRLNRLASRLLDYTKKDELSIEEENINSIIKAIVSSISLEEVIEVNSYGNDIVVKADREKMIQSFLNIIKNGVEAIEKEKNRIFEINMKKIGNIGIIEFKTNGKVEKKLSIKKIFDPFITTKPGGTGLGLAITKKIVQEHGYKIYAVKNRIGGLTLKIVFKEK